MNQPQRPPGPQAQAVTGTAARRPSAIVKDAKNDDHNEGYSEGIAGHCESGYEEQDYHKLLGKSLNLDPLSRSRHPLTNFQSGLQ